MRRTHFPYGRHYKIRRTSSLERPMLSSLEAPGAIWHLCCHLQALSEDIIYLNMRAEMGFREQRLFEYFGTSGYERPLPFPARFPRYEKTVFGMNGLPQS